MARFRVDIWDDSESKMDLVQSYVVDAPDSRAARDIGERRFHSDHPDYAMHNLSATVKPSDDS